MPNGGWPEKLFQSGRQVHKVTGCVLCLRHNHPSCFSLTKVLGMLSMKHSYACLHYKLFLPLAIRQLQTLRGLHQQKNLPQHFSSLNTGVLRKLSSRNKLQQQQTRNPPQHFSSLNTGVLRKLSSRNELHWQQTRWLSSSDTNVGKVKQESVEKQLIKLMDTWDTEAAVKLLIKSVNSGTVPHPNIVLNLQQQLANLAAVESLLELHNFLKEHKLTSDAKFFHCLREAYYNSGRIDEGVSVLRLQYHRTRKFSDVEVYFTLLTVTVLQHFPHHLPLLKSFVSDLRNAEVPVLEPAAALWKCYIMTKHWAEADDLLLKHEDLRSLLPQQVSRICQGVDKVDFDEAAVLTHLLDLTFLRQRLRVLVAETLIDRLAARKEWPRLLKLLKKVKTLALPMKPEKLFNVLDDLRRYLTPQYDTQIDDIRQWCQSLQGPDKQE